MYAVNILKQHKNTKKQFVKKFKKKCMPIINAYAYTRYYNIIYTTRVRKFKKKYVHRKNNIIYLSLLLRELITQNNF